MNTLDILDAIPDARWRAAAAAVWSCLPAHDRATLAARLAGVTIDERLVLRLGGAGTPETDAAGVLRWRVELASARWVGGDSVLAAAIAHELAHVVLQHGEMTAVLGLNGLRGVGYTAADIDQLTHWQEEAAWLQVCLWGLVAEAQEFFRVHPRIRRPAFLAVNLPKS